MSLLSQIDSDFIAAYKAKDSERVAVLRMLKTAIKLKQVELLRMPSDDEVLELVSKAIKQRQESIEQFRGAGREELASKEEREQAILQEYQPPQLSGDELLSAIDETIAEIEAKGPKDMGRVMQAIMNRHKGRVDGKVVSTLVRTRLSS
jgi:uncharacterized protein